jgi:hypothetical protein
MKRSSFKRASVQQVLLARYIPTETKVAGKKFIVTTAIAFVAKASLLASSPICT